MTEVGALTRAIDSLVKPSASSLWDHLTTTAGRPPPGGGQRARKSRPPATLSIVALTMDISAAAREGACDLAGRARPDAPTNLRAIAEALSRRPDDDLTDWWTGAVVEWVHRARHVLGETPSLVRWVYGAACPFCRASVALVRHNAEVLSVPAIAVDWVEGDDAEVADEYRVIAVHCRACGVTWSRGGELDRLVEMMLRTNVGSLIVS
jgi:Zn-finger nucleic acid-binding protein